MWLFSRGTGKDFSYEVENEVAYDLSGKTLWKIYSGKHKVSGNAASIFVFESLGSQNNLELARNTVKRIKTIRHPGLPLYFDLFESDVAMHLATEKLTPLSSVINQIRTDSLQISWGLLHVIKTLQFLHDDAKILLNCLSMMSVFVSESGEWKLGYLDHVTPFDFEGSYPSLNKYFERYRPPEYDNRNSGQSTRWPGDMWGLGCLIWEIFNGELSSSSDLQQTDKIPRPLLPMFRKLVSPKPQSRPRASDVLKLCRTPPSDSFFHNNLIESLIFLEELHLKGPEEQTSFFQDFTKQVDQFPLEFRRHKILPLLLNGFEFGESGSAILPSLLKISADIPDTEYQVKIVPCILKLTSASDRVSRVRLLQQMSEIVPHLQPGIVNEKLFPQLVPGFIDSVPVVRELTVKAMFYLSTKLNHNNLNVELLKHFARLQSVDDQGGIRTNTTICLGRIASRLSPETRLKIIVPAFTRALRDQFPLARVAGVQALSLCQNLILISDLAKRVLPALCSLTIDPEEEVRAIAFKTIRMFLDRIEKASESPEMLEKLEADIKSRPADAPVEASTWAGWVVSTFTKKIKATAATMSTVSNEKRPMKDTGQASISAASTTNSSPTAPKPMKALNTSEKPASGKNAPVVSSTRNAQPKSVAAITKDDALISSTGNATSTFTTTSTNKFSYEQEDEKAGDSASDYDDDWDNWDQDG